MGEWNSFVPKLPSVDQGESETSSISWGVQHHLWAANGRRLKLLGFPRVKGVNLLNVPDPSTIESPTVIQLATPAMIHSQRGTHPGNLVDGHSACSVREMDYNGAIMRPPVAAV